MKSKQLLRKLQKPAKIFQNPRGVETEFAKSNSSAAVKILRPDCDDFLCPRVQTLSNNLYFQVDRKEALGKSELSAALGLTENHLVSSWKPRNLESHLWACTLEHFPVVNMCAYRDLCISVKSVVCVRSEGNWP